MAEPTISDVVTLASAMAAGREKDKDFQELLADISTATRDLVELMEEAQKDRGKAAGEVITAAVGAALKAALVGMPPVQVHVPTPTVTVTGQKDWTTMSCVPDYDPNGRINALVFKRS